MYKTQNEILSQCKKTFNIERDMKQPEKCCCLDQEPNNLLERETWARNRAVMRRKRVVFEETKVRSPG